MADDWQAGDLAECIDVSDLPLSDGVPPGGGKYLRVGMVYLVREVTTYRDHLLCLDVGVECGPKAACRFRKVPPLAEPVPESLIAPLERELIDG